MLGWTVPSEEIGQDLEHVVGSDPSSIRHGLGSGGHVKPMMEMKSETRGPDHRALVALLRSAAGEFSALLPREA